MARSKRRARIIDNGGSHTIDEWNQLRYFYGNKCLSCGSSGKRRKLTKDHVVPLCKGGSNSVANLQPLCKKCNVKKSDKIIDYRIVLVKPDYK